MQRLATIDLPRRLSRRLPRWVSEVGIGVGATATVAGLRAMLAPLPDQLAPFPLVFLAVVLATLVAGWRSGLVATLCGQALVWYFLLPPFRSFEIASPAIGYGLALATATQW